MKNPKSFLTIKRKTCSYRPVCERAKDYKDVVVPKKDTMSQSQAERCMDCGTPFCHSSCPVGNYIPEWNEYLFHGKWEKAYQLLAAGNSLPEVTGRICPALCEYSCTLGINDDPVTIRENELSIIEYVFKNGIIKPNPPKKRTDKKIAIVGSGPAGLACSIELNKRGHNVTVFEKDEKIGGLLRYGIPDFKLEKWIIDRRIDIMKKEGIKFKTNVYVGKDININDILKEFDRVVIAIGSRVPRDLKIKGRELKGIHFAMDYLKESNERNSHCEERSDEAILKTGLPRRFTPRNDINAKNKKVVVIGGGDTGSDCVGTAVRQGAKCVVQIEVMPKPPKERTEKESWPKYPLLLKTSSSHEEGCERNWSILTKEFVGDNGHVKKLKCVKVEFTRDGKMKEIKGRDFEIEADLVLLAVGFIHPEHKGLIETLGIELDKKGNIKGDTYKTSQNKIFSAGDARRGQSLVVWAINEGQECAKEIDEYL